MNKRYEIEDETTIGQDRVTIEFDKKKFGWVMMRINASWQLGKYMKTERGREGEKNEWKIYPESVWLKGMLRVTLETGELGSEEPWAWWTIVDQILVAVGVEVVGPRLSGLISMDEVLPVTLRLTVPWAVRLDRDRADLPRLACLYEQQDWNLP